MTKYNGWSNYETWNFKLWLDNDEGVHNYIMDKIKKISSQKDILSKEEYNKNVVILNEEFENFKKNGKKKIELLKTKRNIGMKKILDELNIVLSEYSKKNELTFIIDQKNIIMGKADLNITNEIIKLLNLKIKKLN